MEGDRTASIYNLTVQLLTQNCKGEGERIALNDAVIPLLDSQT